MNHSKYVPIPVWVANVLVYALGLKNMDMLDTPGVRAVSFGNEGLGCILDVLGSPDDPTSMKTWVLEELDNAEESE